MSFYIFPDALNFPVKLHLLLKGELHDYIIILSSLQI